MNRCHFCQSNSVLEHEEIEAYQYKTQHYNVLIKYTTCNTCNEEFIAPTQIKENEIEIREAKKKIDGLLSREKIRHIRKKLGLTQEKAAIIFGGGKNAFSKYERGEISQSIAMDKLIRLADEEPFIFNKLSDLANFESLEV
ncbi:MAG: type II toxin-antitoxin system MqsA family antitoxin [Cocleimonas sp.]|nr:type II toxin-antitoxin system MqsA family antitoxin [Cocleimonas sp.]